MSPSVVTVASSRKKSEDETDKKEKEKCLEEQERDQEKNDPYQDTAHNGFKNLNKHGFWIYVNEMHLSGVHYRRRLTEKITLKIFIKIKNPALRAGFEVFIHFPAAFHSAFAFLA